MTDERPGAMSAESAALEIRVSPANAIVSERATQHGAAGASNPGSVQVAERRRGVSDLERASGVLAHAMHYLSSEQRAGRCTSVRGNRQAITLLCECAEGLARLENRDAARKAMNTWLAGARPGTEESDGESPARKEF